MPIQLKVRFTDGTLDVRLWRVSDSTIRINVARGAEGEWAGGPSPPPCGKLTRCFSAVAELLVTFILLLWVKFAWNKMTDWLTDWWSPYRHHDRYLMTWKSIHQARIQPQYFGGVRKFESKEQIFGHLRWPHACDSEFICCLHVAR